VNACAQKQAVIVLKGQTQARKMNSEFLGLYYMLNDIFRPFDLVRYFPGPAFSVIPWFSSRLLGRLHVQSLAKWSPMTP